MFFKKSKRIKNLEKEIEELRRLNKMLRLKNGNPLLSKEELKIEKISAIGEFPTWYDDELAKGEVKHKLFMELSPLIKIEEAFNTEENKHLMRATIRIAKER